MRKENVTFTYLPRELVKNDNKIRSKRFPCKYFPDKSRFQQFSKYNEF